MNKNRKTITKNRTQKLPPSARKGMAVMGHTEKVEVSACDAPLLHGGLMEI